LASDLLKGSVETGGGWMLIRADVFEIDGYVVVEAELPGVSELSVQVLIGDGFMTIRGAVPPDEPDDERIYHVRERHLGEFRRDIPLPGRVRRCEASAKRKDGVLRVRIPKDPDAPPEWVRVSLH